MATEPVASHEQPSTELQIRHIDRIASRQDIQFVTDYSHLLLEPHNLTHFGWPLFNRAEFAHLSREEIYDEKGIPRWDIVDKVAEDVSGIINGSEDFFSVMTKTDPNGKQKLVGAGFVSAPSQSENEAWLYKNVVASSDQEGGYGTRLVAARIDEAFRRYPGLKNLYLGVTYDQHIPDRSKVALQHALENMDIFHALRNGGTIDADDLETRLRVIEGIFALHHHPISPSHLRGVLQAHVGRLPIEGLTPESLRVRRDILAGAASQMGLHLTPSEFVYLKLGAFHTQLLSEQGHIHGFSDLPTGRLVMKREVWDVMKPQFEEQGLIM